MVPQFRIEMGFEWYATAIVVREAGVHHSLTYLYHVGPSAIVCTWGGNGFRTALGRILVLKVNESVACAWKGCDMG